MKKFSLLLAIAVSCLASVMTASAQDLDSCMLNLSYYQEHYKQNSKKERHEALKSWRKAYRICNPGTRQNLYIHGATLYRMLIKENAKNEQYKSALIDTLVDLTKLRVQYYPKYAEKAYASLASDVHNFMLDNPQRVYDLLSESYGVIGSAAEPVTYLDYFTSIIQLNQKDVLSVDQVLDKYDEINKYFDEIQVNDTTAMTKTIRKDMENIFINSGVANCDNLVTLFTPRFEQDKDNYENVSKIVKMLGNVEGGDETELFLTAVTQMHALQPNAASAYYLYRLYNSKGQIKEATKYLEEACEGEDSASDTKGVHYYELASMYMRNGNHVKTVEAANKAISLDKTLTGKAYMLIGVVWTSVTCTGNDIETRAKFWVAYDYFSRAKAADSACAEDATKQMNVCSKYFPATAEAFMYDLQDGNEYQVACGGLRATTKVRTTNR